MSLLLGAKSFGGGSYKKGSCGHFSWVTGLMRSFLLCNVAVFAVAGAGCVTVFIGDGSRGNRSRCTPCTVAAATGSTPCPGDLG